MDELTEALCSLDEQTTLALVQERLDAGEDPLAILAACRKGMAIVGELFQAEEYFVSELILSGAIFKGATKLIEPHFKTSTGQPRGTVVIATVKGDIHDIGKDLVVLLLRAANYEVHDLGVNVPPQRIMDTLKETGATVLGLSALLTTSFPAMKATVEAVDAAGLRPDVRIMIGGGSVTERVRDFMGVDALAPDAQTAVDLCNQWIQEASDD